jgi:hypothetical protein
MLLVLARSVKSLYILCTSTKTRPAGEEPCGIVLRRRSSRRKVADLGARTRDLAGARTRPWAAAILVDTSSLCTSTSYTYQYSLYNLSVVSSDPIGN